MNLDLEDYEDSMISQLNNVEMPDFDTVNETVSSDIDNSSNEEKPKVTSKGRKSKVKSSPVQTNDSGEVDLIKMVDDTIETPDINDDDDDENYTGMSYPPSHDY
jgi:hypothetical protein